MHRRAHEGDRQEPVAASHLTEGPAMKLLHLVLLAASSALVIPASGAYAEPTGHITGVGGVFFKSKDPKALVAWYCDVLGIKIEPWGGAMLRYDAPDHPPMVVWSPFPVTTDAMPRRPGSS